MKQIASLFGQVARPPEKSRRSERGDLYDAILSRLNPSRVKARYKPITYGRLSYLLAGVNTKDLYALMSGCLDAERRSGSFSKYFWYAIRPPRSDD